MPSFGRYKAPIGNLFGVHFDVHFGVHFGVRVPGFLGLQLNPDAKAVTIEIFKEKARQ